MVRTTEKVAQEEIAECVTSVFTKYPSIFSRQMEAIMSIILQIFLSTGAVLKIGEYHSDIPQF